MKILGFFILKSHSTNTKILPISSTLESFFSGSLEGGSASSTEPVIFFSIVFPITPIRQSFYNLNVTYILFNLQVYADQTSKLTNKFRNLSLYG